MTIHVEPVAETIRLFSGGRGYGEKYDAAATLVVCGDLAIISALRGEMTLEFWREIQAELKKRGVVDLLTFRHGSRVWYDLVAEKITRGQRFPEVV